MDPLTQELLDKKACEEVLLRYCRTQDWLDTPGQESCFWPDAEIDFGFFEGNGDILDSMYGGRYLDELEKRDGEWRISKRTYVLDWAHQFPNSLQAMTPEDFALNVPNIREPGHSMYRPL